MVSTPIQSMWIGTFHGLCHRMLRENYRAAGLPAGFSIMDEDDSLAMVKRIMKEQGAPEDADARKIQQFIARMKEQGVRSGDVDGVADPYDVGVYRFYEDLCHKEGVLDFAELMLRVSELMAHDRSFLEQYQGKFSYMLVDEFQDTNNLQYQWLKSIAGDRAVIFAVGDDDQSIYGFRGSNPQNMQTFVDEISHGHIIRLEQNYRSTGNILSAANALIDKNQGRLGKNLWTESQGGRKLQQLRFHSGLDEADYVAGIVKDMIQKGEDPKEIAILYRSNYQSRTYEKALLSRAVPYVIYGGTRFYERTEIKNVLAYLRLTVNLNDDGAFRRIVNFPPRGIGEAAVEQIAEIAKANGTPMLEAAATRLEGRAREKIDNFVVLISGMFEAVTQKPLPEFIDLVIKTSGLIDQYSKKEEDKDRVSNLQEMVTAARQFCIESEIPDAASKPAIDVLDSFLATASLESAADKGQDAEHASVYENPRAVTLMTVHAAKGLEFNRVVIGGADDGVFPVDRALQEGGEEEERRLMYVAITRARKELYATCAKQRMIYGEPKELKDDREFAAKQRPNTAFGKKPFVKRAP
jgi:DNA helicase-2/ATP-dependent DNA helicase PcrA